MKIIFLDIDGVLNSIDYQNSLLMSTDEKGISRAEIRDVYGQTFDPRCENWLAYIIAKTKAKIVISSSWRFSGVFVMQKMWEYRKLAGEVIGRTPIHTDNQHTVENGERGGEIAQWLKENEVENYIIIDDDSDMLPEQMQNFVKTDYEFGLTRILAEKAVKILKTQP